MKRFRYVLRPLFCLGAGLAQAQSTAPPSVLPANAAEVPLRRFDAADYTLAYQVFIGTGRLEDAMRVARKAVLSLPRDRDWRRRLAQVAEWLGYTDVAAEQWRALFEMGDHSDAMLAALTRLAPSLDKPSDALPLWTWLARRGRLTPAQWDDIYWQFENSSEPLRGSVFFEEQYRAHGPLRLLEHAARLAENAGDDDRALALYQERVRGEPLSTEALLRATFLHLRRDRIEDALTLMRANAARVPPQEQEFWRLLGQVAWESGDYPTATQAYTLGIGARQSGLGDWTRLIYLVRPQQPRHAAELALQAWQRFDSLDHLQQALEIYANLGDLRAQGRIYDSLDERARTRAEGQIAFLLGRAQYRQRQQQPAAAWSDLRKALQLGPRDEGTVLTLLWFLIDAGWQRELRQMLTRYDEQARGTALLWPAYAAGHQLLGQARRSGAWYRKALTRTPDDPLLLSAYADVLEQQQRHAQALRMRQQAWQRMETLRKAQADAQTWKQRPEFRLWLQSWLRQHPGDPSLRFMRQTLEELRGLEPAADRQAGDELVLAWTLAREQPESARRWAWERYLRLGRPLPAPTANQIALMRNDRVAVEALLDTPDRPLPSASRVESALMTGRSSLALSTAFLDMAREDEDEILHDRFRQNAVGQAHYVETRVFSDDFDLVKRQGVEFGARLTLNARLQLLLGWTQIRQSTSDTDLGSLLSDSDRLNNAELRWKTLQQETRLALTHRAAMADVQGLRLQHYGRWTPRLSYEFEAVSKGEALNSLPLRTAGYADSLSAGATYGLDRALYLRASGRQSRFYTQYDDYLSRGLATHLEAGYRLRSEYPDWRLRLYWQNQSYTRDGSLSAATLSRLSTGLQDAITAGTLDPVGYFIPQDSATLGACLSGGDNLGGQSLQNGYSRAWRPYADVCLLNNSVVGTGYESALGLAGAVIGADQLALQWRASAGNIPGGSSTRTISLRYRLYF